MAVASDGAKPAGEVDSVVLSQIEDALTAAVNNQLGSRAETLTAADVPAVLRAIAADLDTEAARLAPCM